jgi:anti-sigma factor RsiW
MNCRDAESALPLYCGGELSRWRSYRVRRHLTGCSGCRTVLAELNAARVVAREAFEAMPAGDSAESLWESVVRDIRAADAAPDRDVGIAVSQPGRSRRWRIALVPAAAAAAALLVFFAITTDDGDDAPGVDIARTDSNLPPVVESIDGTGTKIMNFATDNPGVTIAWIIEPESDDQ